MKAITRLENLASNAKLLSAFALLAIVAVAPLSTAAFAQFGSYDQSGISVVDVSGDMAYPEEPAILPPEPPTGDVYFDGSTQGWIIINGMAYSSEISISGSAFHLKDGMWQLEADGVIYAADRHATLHLTGFAVDDVIVLHGKGALDTGEPIRVFLRGHFAPTLESGVFALAFTHAGIYNEDTGVRFPLMQTGSVNVYPIVIDPVPLPEPVPMPPAQDRTDLG